MKIWFAAAIPADSQGGVNRNMQGFADGLRKRGHDVDIIYPSSQRQKNYLLFAWALLIRLMKTGKAAPDFLIARSTDGVFCALARRMNICKTRLLLHNHGWEQRVFEISLTIPRDSEQSFFTWKSRVLRFPLLNATLSLCEGHVCGTVDEIQWMRKKYPRYHGTFIYAPNGVDITPSTIERKWNPVFLCIGAWGWRKNPIGTIRILGEVRKKDVDVKVILVGTGISNVPSTVSAVLPGDAVQNISVETMENMSRWYEQCPFLITTSLYEGGHALVILEAMAHGCVVFAKDIPSAREIINHGYNGFLLPGTSLEKDSQVILDAIKDDKKLDEISQRAKKSASRNRWERQARRMERALENIIHN
jgi:glycosyltransferase involved in cell wall biosynthesis